MTERTKKIISYIFLLLSVAITVFAFYSSLCNAEISSAASGGFAQAFKSLLEKFGIIISRNKAQHIVRKTAHFLEFAAQAFCIGMFILFRYGTIYKRLIYILFAGLLTACTDELLQLSSEGRSGQITDVFVDFSGTVAAVILCILIYKMFFRKLYQIITY